MARFEGSPVHRPPHTGRGPRSGSRRGPPSRGGPGHQGDRPQRDELTDLPKHGGQSDWGSEFPTDRDGPPPPPLFDRDEAIQQAVKLLRQLLERDPQDSAYQFTLAKAFRAEIHQGGPRGRHGGDASAVRQAADEAIHILRGLIDRFPKSSVYTYELAVTLCRAAQRIPDSEPGDREHHLQEALQLATQLVSAHPQVPEYRALLASAQRRLGGFAHLRREPEEAEKRYRLALDMYRQLTSQIPSVSLYQVGYAQTLSESAEVERASGRQEIAVETLERAVDIAERCAAAWPRDPMFRDFLADLRRQQQQLEADGAR